MISLGYPFGRKPKEAGGGGTWVTIIKRNILRTAETRGASLLSHLEVVVVCSLKPDDAIWGISWKVTAVPLNSCFEFMPRTEVSKSVDKTKL